MSKCVVVGGAGISPPYSRPGSILLNPLDNRPVHHEYGATLLKSGHISVVVRVVCQVQPVMFIVGERRKIDQTVCLVGRPGKVGGKKVAKRLSAASTNRLEFGFHIGSEIPKPIRIEGVSDAQRKHEDSPGVRFR